MKKYSFRILFVLLALMTLLCIAACSNEAEAPEPEPAETVQYTVTFNTDGGSPIDPVTVTKGQKVKKPADPTKDGFIFGGWWKDANYNAQYVFTSTVKKDLTLYARWYTTEFYMTKGWSELVTTPMWGEPDANTVQVPNAVLQGDAKTVVTNVTPDLEKALADAIADENYFKDVKNIIIIISDGMGITHVQASEQWSGDLIMTKLPNVGASMTLTREGIYTDSAAGGNAISTGYKTTKLFVNMDAEGNNLKNLSELARENNKLVGIVTNAELADATPADFSVHNKNRTQGWTKMCQQQIVFGADLFMGNGGEDYLSYFGTSNDMYKFVQANNMKAYETAEDIVSHFSDDIRMWALFSASSNKFARYDTTVSAYPNLQQMTAYALSWLDSHDKNNNSEQGFVVMIENTYTDHFGHDNVPVSNDKSPNTFGIVKEVQSTDEAVAIALKYVLEHPDTALIVTADHETGDTTLMKTKTGEERWKTDFSYVVASSGDHSTQNVPVFAIGKGTEALNSLERTEAERAAGLRWDEATPYENAKIGQVIGALLLGEDPEDLPFGGDVAKDTTGKTSPKFDVTVSQATNSLTFTLDLTAVPIRSGNLIQFKIKPVSANDNISVAQSSNAVLINNVKFSSTDNEKITREDKTKNVITPLMKAYKQSFVEDSGFDDGWYQISVQAKGDSKQLVITLTPAAGTFAKDAVISMDDLTIQYASTIGELVFSSEKATACGACFVAP